MMKIIPVKYPEINVYNKYANILSLISCDDNHYIWLCNNFIQLYLPQYFDYGVLMDFYMQRVFDECPFIEYNHYTIDEVKGIQPNIIDFIIDNINYNRCLYFDIDKQFIPEYDSTGIHNIFIYGYDEERKILNVADNIFDGKYTCFEVGFDNLSNAFNNVKVNRVKDLNYTDRIDVFSRIENNSYSIDIPKIKLTIMQYLSGEFEKEEYTDPDPRSKITWEFGYKHYAIIDMYIDYIMVNKNDYIDVRPFHLIYEHKKMMVMRMQYLTNNNIICDNIDLGNKALLLEQQCVKLRNIVIKFNVSCNYSLMDKIRKLLKDIKCQELTLLNELLKLL